MSAGRAAPPGPRIPPPLRAIGARLPALPLSFALAQALTLAAPRIFARDDLAALEGVRFRIHVVDAGIAVSLRVAGGRFAATGAADRVDVTFAADAADFARLAARQADPDTMFFERRLKIEGDVDAGLRLRNLLETIDLPSWLTRSRRA